MLTKSFTAFRDNEAGSYNNRSRPVEEDQEFQRHGGRRDDRGARRNDRHSRTGHTLVFLLISPIPLSFSGHRYHGLAEMDSGTQTSKSNRAGVPTPEKAS